MKNRTSLIAQYKRNIFSIIFFLLIFIHPAKSQQFKSHPLADSVFNSLTPDERIQAEFGQRQFVESSLTLLENKNQLIPFMGLDTLRIAALSIGSSTVTPFQKMLSNYTKVDYFNLSEKFTEEELNGTIKKLARYNLVITGIHSNYPKLLSRISLIKNSVLVFFSNPLAPKLLSRISLIKNSVFVFFSNPNAYQLKEIGQPTGLLIAWQNTKTAQELSAQLLFGGIGAKGKLPVSIGNQYKEGDGLTINQPIRLKYTLPEEVGLNSLRLNKGIDSIVSKALTEKAYPGCNVLIAKGGKIIFQKAYGYHTFENRTPAASDDIYDLASVTKVTGALPAIMKLNEEGKYLLDEPFSTYWPDWRKRFLHPSDKNDITLRELLAHQSGLVPFIPFYRQSMENKNLSTKFYRAVPGDGYNLEVSQGLYLKDKFKKKIYKTIRKSPLKTRGKYVYSDLSVILTSDVVTRLSGMEFTEYLDQNFYRPLGATTITYLPWKKFSYERIVPTEYDAIYRKKLVHGSVHDESAATFGGIAGNAGLFASANDLAKLVQMYVQFGTYGGKQYLKSSTLDEFTKVQYPQNNNRRGLGFDKPLLENEKADKSRAYPCQGASPQSFGHFGFTGTFVWADPANGLVYIFLSNRVYPTRNNNKISELGTRTEILQFIYSLPDCRL